MNIITKRRNKNDNGIRSITTYFNSSLYNSNDIINNGGTKMIKHVECISKNYNGLTNGKIYRLEYEGADFVKVINNLNDLRCYPANIFRKLSKQEEVRRVVFTDKINPSYYGTDLDVIDFCQKNNLDFMQGNVVKYVTRYKEKNGKEDLLKAMKYIERMIKENYKEE